MKALLPCPFCGAHNLENLYAAERGTLSPVHCIDCGAAGPLASRLDGRKGHDLANGLDAWNARADESLRPHQLRSLAILLGLSRDASFAECCATLTSLLDKVTP